MGYGRSYLFIISGLLSINHQKPLTMPLTSAWSRELFTRKVSQTGSRFKGQILYRVLNFGSVINRVGKIVEFELKEGWEFWEEVRTLAPSFSGSISPRSILPNATEGGFWNNTRVNNLCFHEIIKRHYTSLGKDGCRRISMDRKGNKLDIYLTITRDNLT